MTVVTGASGGIGRSTALALARDGCAVFAHGGHNLDDLAETMSQLDDVGVPCQSAHGDLSSAEVGESLIDQAWLWSQQIADGRVDAWINLAGADVLTGAAADASFARKLELLWQVDVAATIRLSRAVGKRMRSRGGAIVNVGWDQAAWGMGGDSGELFAATKGAIMSFTLSLAKSLAPTVRVNCVAPGWIQTKWGQQASQSWQERARRESLLERWGRPEDVANAICFLASDRSAFINGQILRVNGGFAGSASHDFKQVTP